MSWKRFQGWEPVRTTTTVDGVQTMVAEPEWDEDERAHMIALAMWEDSRCPLCGGPVEDCQSPEAERRFAGTPPVRCHRTDAIIRYQDKAGEYPRPRALLWRAEDRD